MSRAKRQHQESVRSGWSRGSGKRRRPGREGNLKKRQHYGARSIRRGTAAPVLWPDDREDCACRSGLAYRLCCKKARTFRRRVLRELLDGFCRPLASARLSLRMLGQSFDEAAQARGLRLAITPWLADDLTALGYLVHAGELHGLSLRPRPMPVLVQEEPSDEPTVETKASQTLAGLQLRAHVLAAPADLELRAVYGDWLAERGDPLGELIAVQGARGRGAVDDAVEAQERELLRRHERDALGALAPVVALGGARLHRGFPVSLRLTTCSPDTLSALCDDPSWSTVRELDLGLIRQHTKLAARLVTRPALAGLRTLHGAWPGLCLALREVKVPGVRELTLGESVQHEGLYLAGFPALEHLRLPLSWGQRPAAQLWHHRGLAQLSFYGYAAYVLWQIAPWVIRLHAEPSALEQVTFGRRPVDAPLTGPVARLRRGHDGELSALCIDWQSPVRAGQLRMLLQALEAIPPTILTRLRITAPDDSLTPHARRRIQAQVRRWTRLEQLDI